MRSIQLFSLAVAVFAAVPAGAEVIQFRLLSNYSRATFKTDAPLETIVGNTAAGGLSGALAVDLAKPRGAVGSVRIDMSLVNSNEIQLETDLTFVRQK